MVNLKSVKIQVIVFLSGLAVYLSFKDKDALFLFTTLIAVISAVGIESAILFLKNRKAGVTDSSVISGLIIGCVLYSGNPWWMFTLASLMAICSKYLIQTQKRHLFNPAALGIFSVIILFGAHTQWKGTYLWHILVPFGMYFVYKVRKLEVLIGYGLAALGLFGIQAFLQRIPLPNIFGYLSYFYIFIMLVEPKTTPVKPAGKFIFGISVAVLIFILTEAGARFDAELCALLIMNAFVPLLDRIPERRKI